MKLETKTFSLLQLVYIYKGYQKHIYYVEYIL